VKFRNFVYSKAESKLLNILWLWLQQLR